MANNHLRQQRILTLQPITPTMEADARAYLAKHAPDLVAMVMGDTEEVAA